MQPLRAEDIDETVLKPEIDALIASYGVGKVVDLEELLEVSGKNLLALVPLLRIFEEGSPLPYLSLAVEAGVAGTMAQVLSDPKKAWRIEAPERETIATASAGLALVVRFAAGVAGIGRNEFTARVSSRCAAVGWPLDVPIGRKEALTIFRRVSRSAFGLGAAVYRSLGGEAADGPLRTLAVNLLAADLCAYNAKTNLVSWEKSGVPDRAIEILRETTRRTEEMTRNALSFLRFILPDRAGLKARGEQEEGGGKCGTR